MANKDVEIRVAADLSEADSNLASFEVNFEKVLRRLGADADIESISQLARDLDANRISIDQLDPKVAALVQQYRGLNLAMRLEEAVQGTEQLRTIIGELQTLGAHTGDAEREASALAAEFASLARQQAVVETFKAVSTSAAESARTLEDVRGKSAEAASTQTTLQHNLETSRQALESVRGASADLSGEIYSANVAVKEAEAKLSDLQKAAKAAGKGNEDLKLAVAQAKEELTSAKGVLREKETALQDAERAERSLERAVRDDERALTRQSETMRQLDADVEAATRAHGEQAVQVERAGKAMQYAGLNANDLADEEQRIQRESIEAKNAISGLNERLVAERDALNQTGAAAEKTTKETRELGQEQERTGTKTQGFVGKLKGLGGQLLAFAGITGGLYAAKEGVEAILRTGDQFEIYQKQLDSTFGSAAAGEAAFEWVRDFARDAPLEMDQVLQATIKLKNFGLDPLDGTLQALVDQNAKLGGSQETLNRIITAAGQAYAKGRLQGEELLQFAEAGVPVFTLLSEATGKSTAEVIKMATAGELGRDAIRELIKAIGDSAVGAAADQMNTLSGQVSRAKDAYQQFLAAVSANGPLQFAKDALGEINIGLEETGGAARAVGQSLVAMANAVLTVFNLLKASVLTTKTIIEGAVGGIFKLFSIVLDELARKLEDIPFIGDTIASKIREVGDSLNATSDDLLATARKDAAGVGDAYTEAYIRFGGVAAGAYEAVMAASGRQTDAAKAAAEAQKKSGDEAVAAQGAAEKAAQAQAEGLEELGQNLQALGVDYEALSTGISSTAQAVIDNFGAAAQKVSDLGLASDEAATVMDAAFAAALGKLGSPPELEALRTKLGTVKVSGYDAAKGVEEIDKKLKNLGDTSDTEIGKVEDAYKRLGITSSATLQQQATEARAAAEAIAASGAPIADQEKAWLAVLEAELKAADAAGDEFAVKVIAANAKALPGTEDFRAKVREIADKYVEVGKASEDAAKQAETSAKTATKALEPWWKKIKDVADEYKAANKEAEEAANRAYDVSKHDPRAIEDRSTGASASLANYGSGVGTSGAILQQYAEQQYNKILNGPLSGVSGYITSASAQLAQQLEGLSSSLAAGGAAAEAAQRYLAQQLGQPYTAPSSTSSSGAGSSATSTSTSTSTSEAASQGNAAAGNYGSSSSPTVSAGVATDLSPVVQQLQGISRQLQIIIGQIDDAARGAYTVSASDLIREIDRAAQVSNTG